MGILYTQVLKERFGVNCMLGLTATATVSTACSVAQHLGIHDYQTATIRGSPVPDNLQLSVSKDENIDEVNQIACMSISSKLVIVT